MNYGALKLACVMVEPTFPKSRDSRFMVNEIAAIINPPPDSLTHSANKGVGAWGRYVVKTANRNQIEQAVKLAAALGDKFAAILAHGPRWMIQERVEPCDGKPLADELAGIAGDIRHNCGTDKAGNLVAFDGFLAV
jgi:hypothetical protein